MANIKRRGSDILTRDGVVTCTCCDCGLTVSSSGGDDGWSETFNVEKYTKNKGFKIRVFFDAYSQEDRFVIHGLYDTGCIGSGDDGTAPCCATDTVTIPKGRKSVTLQVIPNCANNGSGTIWVLSIECIGEESDASAP